MIAAEMEIELDDTGLLVWLDQAVRNGTAQRIRQRAAVRLDDVAEAVGTSRVTVNRWERGRVVPAHPLMALAYARVLKNLAQRPADRPLKRGPKPMERGRSAAPAPEVPPQGPVLRERPSPTDAPPGGPDGGTNDPRPLLPGVVQREEVSPGKGGPRNEGYIGKSR